MDHSELLVRAKQQQRDKIGRSEAMVGQLAATVEMVVKLNSRNDSNGSSLMDKITTIHELDKEVDKQTQEVTRRWEEMRRLEKQLEKVVGEGEMAVQVERIQRRVEAVDRELRVMERAMDLREGGG